MIGYWVDQLNGKMGMTIVFPFKRKALEPHRYGERLITEVLTIAGWRSNIFSDANSCLSLLVGFARMLKSEGDTKDMEKRLRRIKRYIFMYNLEREYDLSDLECH